jgi:fructose-bisphosphate aldolase class 1
MIKSNILFVLYFAGLLVSSNTYKLAKNRFDSSHRVFSNKNTQSAEGIANNLQTLGFKVSAILDDDPISPIVKNNVEYFYGDIDKELLDNKGKSFISSSLLKDKLVIVVGDSVPEANDNNDELSFELYRKVSKVLPNNLKGLVCVAGSDHEEDSNLFAKIKGGAGGSGVKVFRKFCSDNSIPLSILKFGKLTGGIPGAEPLPFMVKKINK